MIANDLLKGTLKTIILKLLAEHRRLYGYEITKKVEEMTDGKIVLTFGALYPILHKLESEGLVSVEKKAANNRIRVYYSLTSTGKKDAKLRASQFIEFVQTMQLLLQPAKKGI